MSPEDMQLTPEGLFRLVEFLVERGHAKAAVDIMNAVWPRHHETLMAQLAEQRRAAA